MINLLLCSFRLSLLSLANGLINSLSALSIAPVAVFGLGRLDESKNLLPKKSN